jgi:small subunit ribosomal protein S17
MTEKKTGLKKTLQGMVVGDRMEKTVVVAVQRSMRHALYHKTLRKTRRYKAHDERNECHVGDTVRIMECRPVSRDKKFRVVQIVERAK